MARTKKVEQINDHLFIDISYAPQRQSELEDKQSVILHYIVIAPHKWYNRQEIHLLHCIVIKYNFNAKINTHYVEAEAHGYICYRWQKC